jgi:MoaA/NifB/PqqE/SkfB family radical SAM enzyme
MTEILNTPSVKEDYSGEPTGNNIALPLSGIIGLYSKFYFNDFKLDELIFSITDKCQFRCKTCFYADTMDESDIESVKGLSLEEIRKISASMGRSISKLLITGGEPFLRDDIADICHTFYVQNKIRHISIPTNAFQPDKNLKYTEDILKRCPDLNLTIGISLDGFAETHLKIRGIKGSFDKAVETAHSLAELKKRYKNLRLNVVTVVNHLNIDEMLDFAEYVKNELPVDNHGPVPMRGDPYDKDLRPPTAEQWDELSKKLIDYQGSWNNQRDESFINKLVRTNREKYLYKVYTNVMKGEGLPFQCQAGEVIGVLEANGDVRVCELKDPIGNVKSFDYDFKKVWFSKEADEMRKTVVGCSCTHPCFINSSNKVDLTSLISSAWNA